MLRKMLCCLLALLALTPCTQAEENAMTFDPNQPKIALTFDDGPGEFTQEMLDILAENGVRATFFVVGTHMEVWPELVTAVHDAGHEVGLHTWKHENLNEQTDYYVLYNLMDCQEWVERLTGEQAKWLRPPYGITGGSTYFATRKLGLRIVTWSVDSEDWLSQDPQKIYDRIMKGAKDGAVILCHDTYEPTLEAMRRVLPALKEQGYQFLTVSELFSLYEGELKSNAVYYCLDPAKAKK